MFGFCFIVQYFVASVPLLSYAYRLKGDQMFYLLVKVSFACLLPVSLNSLCISVLCTKSKFHSLRDLHPMTDDDLCHVTE